MRTYYEVLGVLPTATEQEINLSYRRLARQTHPDVHAGRGAADVLEATRRMAAVNEAFHVLGNRERRAEYDRRVARVSHRTAKDGWLSPTVPPGFDLFPSPRGWRVDLGANPEAHRYGYRFADEQHHALSLEAIGKDLSGLQSAAPDIAWLIAAHDRGVNDDQLVHVSRLTKLQTLDLAGTGVTDAGVVRLGRLSTLGELSLAETKITDEALRSIGQLDALQLLNVARTSITDDGLAHLCGLADLHALDLHGTRVSPGCRVHLAKLAGLRIVHLPMRVSLVARLRRWPELRDIEIR